MIWLLSLIWSQNQKNPSGFDWTGSTGHSVFKCAVAGLRPEHLESLTQPRSRLKTPQAVRLLLSNIYRGLLDILDRGPERDPGRLGRN